MKVTEEGVRVCVLEVSGLYAVWASNRATAGEMVQIFRIRFKEIQNSLHRQS